MHKFIVAICAGMFCIIAFADRYIVQGGVYYLVTEPLYGTPRSMVQIRAYLAPNGRQSSLNVMESFEETLQWAVAAGDGSYQTVYAPAKLQVVQVDCTVGFLGCTEEGKRLVQSISLPEGLVKVGSHCFEGFSSLKELYIPDSVKVFGGGYICRGCSSLERVHLPKEVSFDDLSVYCSFIFDGCTSLKVVELPETLAEIFSSMFLGCSSLESIVIPNQVTSISGNAFNGCSALKSIDIPAQVSFIGNYAFYNCSSLTSITIRAKNFTIGTDAFYGCNPPEVTLPADFRLSRVFPVFYTNIKKVNILGTESGVCDFAFSDCRNLSEVVIGDGVSKIGESAFENCRRLESVTIPASVQKIHDYAFYGCGGLKEVEYAGETPEIGIGAFTGTAVASPSVQTSVALTVTNVVVQYVLNSVRPEFALPPSSDTGFMNVIAEVKGGSVAIPSSWSTAYPKFTTKFGTDFTKALAMQTGKKDGAGNPMFVWQDYVAGTDPTDETDVFAASITIVDGKVKVSYSPELDDARKALRKYTTYGKAKLTDKDWSIVGEGEEDKFNFFKVTVEMR